MSAGQVAGVEADFIVLPWNDLALLEAVFAEAGASIAAVMMEPMMCNTGAIPPEPGYLAGARRLCDDYGALLFLDEVITGFRLGLTGAQGRFGVRGDLVTYAKALAGGFASAALVGRREYMARFASDVNHSGTFNSNVIAMAATAAALRELERDDGAVYRRLEHLGSSLMAGIRAIVARLGLPVLVQGLPMVFHLAFTDLERLRDYRDYALDCDQARYNRFTVAMLSRGVRLAGRGIWYLSAAHDEGHIARTLQAVEDSLREVKA
jgi:glutamate-1-semialdehyde 2,1-aminomutase